MKYGFVVLTADDGTDEIRPTQLTWRGPAEFMLSGKNRRSEIGHVVVRFQTDEDAKNASVAVTGLGWVEQVPVGAPEVTPVEIRSTVILGSAPLLIAVGLCGNFLTIFVVNAVLQFVIGLFFSGLVISGLVLMFVRRIRSGPATSLFRSRNVKAQVFFEDGFLVTNISGTKEAVKVSKLVWVDDKSFKVSEGESTFQLTFRNQEDAARVASMIGSAPAYR